MAHIIKDVVKDRTHLTLRNYPGLTFLGWEATITAVFTYDQT